MSTNTVESPPVEETVQTPLQEALTPLLAYRDQVASEAAEAHEHYKAKKAELDHVERVLRAGEMIAPKQTSSKVKGEAEPSLLLPQEWPTHGRAVEACKKVIAIIEEFDGEEFQIPMIAKQTGSSNQIIERAIGVMNGEGRIRILGKRPQIGRKTPGGTACVTFKEIKD